MSLDGAKYFTYSTDNSYSFLCIFSVNCKSLFKSSITHTCFFSFSIFALRLTYKNHAMWYISTREWLMTMSGRTSMRFTDFSRSIPAFVFVQFTSRWSTFVDGRRSMLELINGYYKERRCAKWTCANEPRPMAFEGDHICTIYIYIYIKSQLCPRMSNLLYKCARRDRFLLILMRIIL